jgi:16S rRNA (guanine527-N7)-methyltransferase
MRPARIAELLEPFLAVPATTNRCHSEERSDDEESAVLSKYNLEAISNYIDILLRWNARINLTAIRDPEEIVTRHFGESLFAARHLFPMGTEGKGTTLVVPQTLSVKETGLQPRATRIADLGSGAGFPGIPIKLWVPHIAVTLIESNQKKVAFLREIARALKLTDVNIFAGRAESLAASSFDVVTLRAVERFAAVLPTASRVIVPGGRLALLIGSSQVNIARSALPSFDWRPSIPIPLSDSRVLLCGIAPVHEC